LSFFTHKKGSGFFIFDALQTGFQNYKTAPYIYSVITASAFTKKIGGFAGAGKAN